MIDANPQYWILVQYWGFTLQKGRLWTPNLLSFLSQNTRSKVHILVNFTE